MKKDRTDKNCALLEEQAFSNEDSSMKEWGKHAESCSECLEKIDLIKNISDSIDKLDLTMGRERLDALDKALEEKRRNSQFRHIYKYAAAAALVLIAFIIFNVMKQKVYDKSIVNRKTDTIQETSNPELDWDYKFDKRQANLTVAKLNRLRTESRRESLYPNRFKKRCRETENRINNLKNKEVFM